MMLRATIAAVLLFGFVCLGGLVGCGDDTGACYEGTVCRDTTQADCRGIWQDDLDCD
jgi:hypothetical protein